MKSGFAKRIQNILFLGHGRAQEMRRRYNAILKNILSNEFVIPIVKIDYCDLLLKGNRR